MVYVDDMNARYRGMIMCHMVADTLEELHVMAEAIGLKEKWFQTNGSVPHYDICLSKKRLALAKGAKQITTRELVILKRFGTFEACK